MAIGPDRLRVLVLDDNPFVRRTLENRAYRRADVLLETFARADALLARIDALAADDPDSVDLVVYDGEMEEQKLSASSALLVDELLERKVPLLLLVVDRSCLVVPRRGVLRCEAPVSFDEIVTLARWRAKRVSGSRSVVGAPRRISVGE